MNENRLSQTSIALAALIIGFVWLYTTGPKTTQPPTEGRREENPAPVASVSLIPDSSDSETKLPIPRRELLAKLVETGVIDPGKIEIEKLTDLHLLWAFGLANKNPILENGPMMDPRYGGAGRFASTGGWTLAKGNAMDHYSRHSFITLTAEQQALVERVSQNIYRPCCDNSTYFPDCNHGMAMLGLLELLASQGASENQMYATALQMNSLWFPEQYAVIARYFESKGQTLETVDPKEILGSEYSSGSGFSRIAALVPQTERQSGSSCGV